MLTAPAGATHTGYDLPASTVTVDIVDLAPTETIVINVRIELVIVAVMLHPLNIRSEFTSRDCHSGQEHLKTGGRPSGS